MAANRVADKVRDTAKEDLDRARTLAQDAFKSQAYLYPLKGIFYFVSHRDLWKPLMSKLAPTLTTAVGVTTFMFAVTYLPQAALLTLFNGPLAFISTLALVLSESSTITNLLARGFFIEDSLIDTFDATLVAKNSIELVKQGREIKAGRGDSVAKLGKMLKKPFARFTPSAIVRYFMYLPLNFIPIVGTVLFIILQGKRFGPNAHARYFQLKGMSGSQKQEYIEKRKAAYTSFGIPASFLEMIPFVGIFFIFTNTVGAALWAADMEAAGGPQTAPRLTEQANKATGTEL